MLTFNDLRGRPERPAGPALFDLPPVVRTFDTPEFRGVTFYEVQAKSLLNRVPSAGYLPFEWTVNVYRGCTHACTYCFARPTHTYLNFGAGEDFERRIVVKVNAAEVLRRELRRPTWRGEHVAMGTNTDPYQRCEGRYRLTRAVLEVFRDFRNPCSVLTKSPLVTRDLDVMTELRDVTGFSAALSIGTLDEDAWRSTEPGTPHPRARIDAVRRLREAGIDCGVLVAPILPGISDHPDQLKAVVDAAAEAGATHISAITLHLRPGVKEVFMDWLAREHPELVAGYERMYRGANAPKPVREAIAARVRIARARAEARRQPTATAVSARFDEDARRATDPSDRGPAQQPPIPPAPEPSGQGARAPATPAARRAADEPAGGRDGAAPGGQRWSGRDDRGTSEPRGRRPASGRRRRAPRRSARAAAVQLDLGLS